LEVLPRGSPIPVFHPCLDVMLVGKEFLKFQFWDNQAQMFPLWLKGGSENDGRFTFLVLWPQRNDDDDDGTLLFTRWMLDSANKLDQLNTRHWLVHGECTSTNSYPSQVLDYITRPMSVNASCQLRHRRCGNLLYRERREL